MEEQATNNLQTRKHRQKSLIIIPAAILVLLVMFSVYFLFINKGIYSGVKVNEINASGMTQEELKKALTGSYLDKANTNEIVLKNKNATSSIKFSDLGVHYDIEKAVKEAYEVGRTDNIIKRISKIYNTFRQGVNITLGYSSDPDKTKSFVDSFYEKALVNPVESSCQTSETQVRITSAKSGEKIDKDKAISEIKKAVSQNIAVTIDVPLEIIAVPKLNAEELYKNIHVEPKDAAAVVNNGQVDIIHEELGKTIDKTALAAAVEELNKTEGLTKTLPLTILQPKITEAGLRPNILKNTLSSASTQFYTDTQNNKNRGINIRLAVAKINGTVLSPGETFSFNEVVGERTVANGYQVAHVYSNGQIVDDVGGGICQVSTTLYNALRYADLQVTQRVNHMFTVGYIPIGMDAAVSYPDVDLKFTNSTILPIMIQGSVTDDNRVIFTIKGFKENPGRSVEFYSNIVATYNFETIYTDDSSIAAGESLLWQEGMTGYLVDTYKIVKQDGKIVSEEKIYSSSYQPLSRIILRGTKNQ